MRFTTQGAVLLVAIAAGVALFAQSGETAYRYSGDCKTPTSDFERQSCERRDFDLAEAALNRSYRALRDRLIPADRAVLVQSQIEWVRERDSICGDGSDAFAVEPICAAQMTTRRTSWLDARLRECKGASCHVVFRMAEPADQNGTH